MRRAVCSTVVVLGIALALPAPGELRYFGYADGADDASALRRTRAFTNFAYTVASARPTSALFRARVEAMSRRGIKALVDLSPLLWTDVDGDGAYDALFPDWKRRWAAWKLHNASVLSPRRVLGFAVLDEPFLHGVDMAEYESAARQVRTDFPWSKLLLVEAACAVAGRCGTTPRPAFEQYRGNLPAVDWIGLDAYGIHPATDPLYQDALARLSTRFPDRERIYVLDGFWTVEHSAVAPTPAAMGEIAREWYEVARSDPGAILLGVFSWGPYPPGTIKSKDLPCAVLGEHVAIGRAITGKRAPSRVCERRRRG